MVVRVVGETVRTREEKKGQLPERRRERRRKKITAYIYIEPDESVD